MIQYRLATCKEIDLLVNLRIKELAMFSSVPFPKEYSKEMYNFYEEKMKNNTCFTIFGYDNDLLIATGLIYFCDTLPSNANPSGKTGYISNIWTHEEYRRQGIASEIMEQLVSIAKERCGLICLNASEEGEGLYLKMNFVKNKKAMLYINKEY